jgi:hypothetical protein
MKFNKVSPPSKGGETYKDISCHKTTLKLKDKSFRVGA